MWSRDTFLLELENVSKYGKAMVRLKAKKTQSSIDSIGERLRKAREDKGISLEEVHKTTKIHPNVLEALEEDRLENILGKAYVKVFLKNYAHYLGLDVKEIAQQYAAKHGPETTERPAFVLKQKPISQKRTRNISHAIIVALAFIVWIFILSFTTVKFIHYSKDVTKRREVIALKKAELKEKVTKRGLIPIPKSRTIMLTIITSKDVWLKVTQDGEVAFQGILSKNSKETWRADKEILLSEIGRPEALKLNVNGKDIDFSERRLGKNILITHKGINLGPKP